MEALDLKEGDKRPLEGDRAAPCPDCAGRCENTHTIKLHRTPVIHVYTHAQVRLLCENPEKVK